MNKHKTPVGSNSTAYNSQFWTFVAKKYDKRNK